MKKTSGVIADMDALFAAEQLGRKEDYAQSRDFVRGLCDAGLVDDVAPDGPVPNDQLTLTCGHCGTKLTGPVVGDPDVFEDHRKVCARVPS